MAEDPMVGIPQIAQSLGLDGGTVRRLIARESESLNLRLHRGKGDKLFLPEEDAQRLIASYKARRGPVAEYQPRRTSTVSGAVDEEVAYDVYGSFYIIQLIPEALPNRVKIGFSNDPDARLAQHRTAAPTAKLLKSWPCKRSWDYAAMDSITRKDCKLVLNEVYECDVEGFLQRGNAFFSLMPDPNAEKELSEFSPLYEAGKSDDGNEKLEMAAAASSGAEDADQ